MSGPEPNAEQPAAVGRLTVDARRDAGAPRNPETETAENLFGFMRGSVIIPPDFDLTEVIGDVNDFAVAHGIVGY